MPIALPKRSDQTQIEDNWIESGIPLQTLGCQRREGPGCVKQNAVVEQASEQGHDGPDASEAGEGETVPSPGSGRADRSDQHQPGHGAMQVTRAPRFFGPEVKQGQAAGQACEVEDS